MDLTAVSHLALIWKISMLIISSKHGLWDKGETAGKPEIFFSYLPNISALGVFSCETVRIFMLIDVVF